MSLDDWFGDFATATVRDSATVTGSTAPSVAIVASVAVADVENASPRLGSPDESTAPDSDSRRTCEQCRNLADLGLCLAAYRGVPLGFSTPKVYHPAATLPQHCAGYLPFPDDPDQRPGSERWPHMQPTGE